MPQENLNTSTGVVKETPQASGIQKITSSLINFLPLILIFIVFYFLVIRPQDKKRKQHENLVNSLKKGDNVITHSGIYGVIQKINNEKGTIELETSKNNIIQMSKNSILSILNNKSDKSVSENKN